jgi:hypothetical protein
VASNSALSGFQSGVDKRKAELILVPIAEGFLLLALGGIGLFLKLPLVVTSLAPTAYEQIEKPAQKSSTPYNILVGHFMAVIAALCSLALLRAFHNPSFSKIGYLTADRVFASVLSCVMTAFLNLLLKASQPAAFSTALLITLGTYQSPRAVFTIVLAVMILTVLGEPLRRKSLQLRNLDEIKPKRSFR